jgi:hypothetical protein
MGKPLVKWIFGIPRMRWEDKIFDESQVNKLYSYIERQGDALFLKVISYSILHVGVC